MVKIAGMHQELLQTKCKSFRSDPIDFVKAPDSPDGTFVLPMSETIEIVADTFMCFFGE
jgi:hypothetical protein